jgi:two-component system, OmpR family, response regulator
MLMAMSPTVTESAPNDASLMARTILLIEDDPDIAAAIEAELLSEGYRVEQAGTFEEGMEAVRASHPSAILLDRGLNGEDGLRILESMRGEGDHTPALVISAMSTVDDRILGLKAGGDDYLTKPFDLRELSARLEALLRRRGEDRVTRLHCRDIEMDLVERAVTCGGEPVSLLPREFRLLEYFMRHAGQVVTRGMLLEEVWNFKFLAQTNVVDVQIGNLRRKLDPDGGRRYIVNVRGVGFKLNVED